MNIRSFGLAAAITLLTPAISNASPERSALNACARAFASSLASPGAVAPAFKLVYGGSNGGSVSEFFVRQFTFELYANSLKTGLPIARASCSTDAGGSVVALSSIPLDTARPTLAARN